MRTYVLRYGAAFASEIYHYLTASNFKAKVIGMARPLKVVSLGCGFSPDYFAIRKYLEDNNICLAIEYFGLDKSNSWGHLRPDVDECQYCSFDITQPFPQFTADLVVVSKLFSTLYRNNETLANTFLNRLEQVADLSFGSKTTLIFVDVNLDIFGRDVFHDRVSLFLPNYRQYYYDGYSKDNWIKIAKRELVFDIPTGLSVDPLTNTGKTVIFEYRK
jgi:hypothetical protein